MIVSCSAGTMNSAGTVYCPPEEPGEALDEHFPRFYRGLSLTDINVCPHLYSLR